MTTIVVTTKITHRYLMNKSKWDLASWIMDDLDKMDKLEASLATAQAENGRLTACLKRNSHDECNCKACVDVRETLKESEK